MYDAVGLDRGRLPAVPERARCQPGGVAGRGRGDRGVQDARLALPSQLSTLQPKYDASLALVLDPVAKAQGIAAGEAAAAAMIAARGAPPSGPAFVPPTLPQPPGVWRLSPPVFAGDPQWWVGERTRSSSRTRRCSARRPEPAHEPALRQGLQRGQAVRLVEQHEAHGRPDDGGDLLAGPAARVYGALMRSFSTVRADRTAQNARMFAMTTLASADAAIGCWNDKYYWDFWRPVDAIGTGTRTVTRRRKVTPSWCPLRPSTPSTRRCHQVPRPSAGPAA